MQAVGQIGRQGYLGFLAGRQKTLFARALAILAKYGSAANLYLPGVGQISGLQAGNWLDSAGGVPAAVDGPVGFVTNATSTTGPELKQNFVTGVGGAATAATYNTTTGAGSCTRVDLANQSFVRITGLTATLTYRMSISNTGAAAIVIRPLDYGGSAFYTIAAGNTATVFFTGNANCVITSQGGTATFVVNTFANITGAHLTQATTASKPILRRGLVNILRRSADYANTDQWLATNLSFASTVGPSGANDATIITATNAASAALISSVTPPIATSEVVTLAYVVKATGENYSRTLLLRNGTTATNFQAGSFYCLNGQVTGAGWQSTAIGNGWFVVTFTQSTGIAIGNTLLAYGGFAGAAPQGGVGSTFVVHRIGLFAGAVTAQQIIDSGGIPVTTAAPAGSTNGPFAWQFDGSNDSFTSTLTPGNTGFLCMSASFTNFATTRTLIGGGASSSADAGVRLQCSSAEGVGMWGGNGMGRDSVSIPFSSTERVVVTGWWDLNTVGVSVNNTESSITKSRNYTSSNTINVGVLTGTTNPMLGTIGATILMPTVLPTPGERDILRRAVASLSGVTF